MRMIIKRFMGFLLLAATLTGLSMLIEYQYCMGGPGRGLPCAILRPTHHTDRFAIQLEPQFKSEGQEFSFTSLFCDLAFYTFIAWIGSRVLVNFRKFQASRRTGKDAEPPSAGDSSPRADAGRGPPEK